MDLSYLLAFILFAICCNCICHNNVSLMIVFDILVVQAETNLMHIIYVM